MRTPVAIASALISLALLAAALPPAQDGQAEARAKELLAPFAGNWDTEYTMPGMPPMKGTEVVKALPHGLSVIITSTGDMGDMGTYEGHGVIGFDRKAGKWIHVWTDNVDAGISVSEGRWSEDGKSFLVEMEEDMGMGPVKAISTMRIDDKDHMTWTMCAKDAPADAAPMMSAKYTRKR
jgi:hypothetical protein